MYPDTIRVPSVLGMDFMKQYKVSFRRNRVVLEQQSNTFNLRNQDQRNIRKA